MKKWLSGVIFLLVLLHGAVGLAQPQIPPAPVNSIYIQDFAGIVHADTKDRINKTGAYLTAKTKAQIVVVTVKKLDNTPIEEYALALLRQWGVGDKKLNNGVVMLIAVDDRRSRIEVGYGLEGALPDAKTGSIQDDYMLPYFQEGDFNKGIWNGYLALTKVVAKEYNLEWKSDESPTAKHKQAGSGWWSTLPWWAHILMGLLLIALLLFDWIVFNGTFTFLILSLFRGGRGGGGGDSGGGFGGGSGGGGGSNRSW